MKHSFLIFNLIGILFAACTDNDDKQAQSFTPPTSSEFARARQDFLNSITQTKTFDAATGLEFVSPQGVKVSINYLVDKNYQSVTGEVQLKYIELFDIGSMALADKPLVGKDFQGNTGPLVTGGEFFMEVTQNGKKLDGGANLEVPFEFTQGADPDDMSPWALDSTGVWVQGKGEVFPGGRGAHDHYSCYFQFDWTNIDWLSGLDGEKTEIRVRVPEGYNDKNCSVYAAYLGKPNMLASFDVYNAEDKYFTEHTGLAPIGFQMYVIFVSLDAKTKQFLYAIKLVTIEANQYVEFTEGDLHSASIQQIIDAINSLHQ